MKLLILLFLLFLNCAQPGTTEFRNESSINGHSIKVYDYSLGSGRWIKIAFVDDQVNSTNWQEGKFRKDCIIVSNKQKSTTINGEIILENDSLIMIRKTK